MQPPISIQIDLSTGVGYVRFRELADGERAHGRRIEIGSPVVIDRDADNAIVGIELLELTGEAMNTATA
jgi:hypothetical protein